MSTLKLLCIHPGAGWSTADVYDGYTKAWKEQGHDVVEYLLDQRVLAASKWLAYQYRHAGPGGVKPQGNDVLYLASFEAVIKALAQDVDWVMVFSGRMFHPGVFQALRKAGLHCAVLLTESPYEDERQLWWSSLANVAFTNERTSIGPLSIYNQHVHYLPHAYDPQKHYPRQAEEEEGVPAHDVVFVGTEWQERVETFQAVDWAGIDFGLYGMWRKLPSRHRLRRYLHPGIVDNRVTAALYRRAAIGLNPHRQSVELKRAAPRITTAESMNPRAVELAACGCFSISDDRAEVQETFGDLVPTYKTPKQLEELIRYYLGHPDERADIAAQLPACIKDRTFAALGRQVIETLEAYDGTT